MPSSNIYEPPRIRGHLLPVVAAICSWILMATISLIYLFCSGAQPVLDIIAFLCLVTCFICWTMKGVLELGFFLISLMISSIFITILQVLQFVNVFHGFSLPVCAEGQSPKKDPCSNFSPSAGYIIYLIFFFVLFLFDIVFIPLTVFFTAKLFIHRWKMRHVHLIAPMLEILAATTATQTDEEFDKNTGTGFMDTTKAE